MPSCWQGLICTAGATYRCDVTRSPVATLNKGDNATGPPTWQHYLYAEQKDNEIALFTRHQSVSAAMLEIAELELGPGNLAYETAMVSCVISPLAGVGGLLPHSGHTSTYTPPPYDLSPMRTNGWYRESNWADTGSKSRPTYTLCHNTHTEVAHTTLWVWHNQRIAHSSRWPWRRRILKLV